LVAAHRLPGFQHLASLCEYFAALVLIAEMDSLCIRAISETASKAIR